MTDEPLKRRFRLPGVEDLTKEQDRVLALPMNGRHLVVGGPGTGKTVVCLLRARRLVQRRDDYVFLVYLRLLRRASSGLFDGELRADTWKAWFRGTFRKVTGASAPHRGQFWDLDWDAIARIVDECPPQSEDGADRPVLVIDEGQDMPPGFYDALNQFGFEHIFVAADQNQQITEEHSSRRELVDSVCPEEVIELTHNHRNPYPVARLARHFYTGDRASPPPELPSSGGSASTPRLLEYREAELPGIAMMILKHWDQNPRRLIGVIAPNNEVRERYCNALTSTDVTLDHGRAEDVVETWFTGHQPDVRFDRGGILVINAQSCKGQEFDTVFLADIDRHWIRLPDTDAAKKLFYVMVSRARERIILLRRVGSFNPGLDEILPKDEDILRRDRLGGMSLATDRRNSTAITAARTEDIVLSVLRHVLEDQTAETEVVRPEAGSGADQCRSSEPASALNACLGTSAKGPSGDLK